MTTSYDSTVIGGLRVDVSRILIDYSPTGNPVVNIVQTGAVTMNDGTIQWVALPANVPASFSFPLDLQDNASIPIQEVDFNTGAVLTGQTTTLENVLLGMLAVIRAQQTLVNP